MTRSLATAIGFTAILMWALLALFTVGSGPVPPLQLNAICFSIGGAIGLIWCAARPGGFARMIAPGWKVIAFGTAGLFGYHFFYFSALRVAPPAQAGLVAYLWPLLIVLLSGLLPGERLRAGHVLGAITGFVGAALLISKGGAGLSAEWAKGYALAFACALTWSSYTVLSRRLGAAPSEVVTLFCLASALLSAVAHLALEETAWPHDGLGWASMLALGLGPVGLAFYVWDIGVKRGNIQLLGTASYAAPLLSTLVLVLAGVAKPTEWLAASALLITLGAVLAARASARAPKLSSPAG
ncbi:DMT family transporter [Vannielia litorea]|uniref:Permease of the drug/metabolite transporter (DMT) superfamily n=1 Tax=Vannielia litorea TaxID=1217970 RepID=A0A1N6DUS9_9RHOB|nr:DMT family transporter [Vannielia litorea]SIN74467.1 Permease of the drug/metabolite transporter (DMT) superfamily [Vannielia litorea]